MKTIALGLVALSALAAGCASTPLPADRMGNAQASIRGAEVAGARGEPTAALHLRLAQENYDKAIKMAKDGDTERAKLVLQRSEADAELALLLAKEHTERAEAQRLMEQAQGGVVVPPPASPVPATPAPQTPVP
ncbi:MAG TPA: DUF4398 domain-containing protein [Polyangiaceae bacterium]|nr:DUF4398 domain-containing protein [Polyangiaceae bacterium]